MPEISRFYGIVIALYFADHPPPHFHARYGSQVGKFSIPDIALMEGHLPPRVVSMVREWGARHGAELQANWTRARERRPLARIEPLE